MICIKGRYLSLFKKLSFSLLLSFICFQAVAEEDYTDPRLYHPFSEAPFQATPVITHHLFGTCREQSYLDKRDDAWRCETKNATYDPCFIKKHGSKNALVCPLAPWQDKAIMISIDAPLDNSNHETLDMSKTEPWAVELTNGKRCKRLSHPIEDETGETAHYRCGDNTLLIGNFYRCKGLWEIYLKEEKSFQTAYVKRAWF